MGIVIIDSDEVINIFTALQMDFDKLKNGASDESSSSLGKMNNSQYYLANPIIDEVRSKFREIKRKLKTSSDEKRVKHELAKLEKKINQSLGDGYEPNQEHNMIFDKKLFADISLMLLETKKNIKKVLWQSPEEELVHILHETKEKIRSVMEKQEIC